MRYSLAAPLAMAASAVATGVTSAISPKTTAPAGCSSSYSGTFAIEIVNVTSSRKRSVEKRADTTLVLSLSNGVLVDASNRTGYIASNYQFQFDSPAQAGAIYTAGWSVCSNGSLALGNDAIFYECLSGTFYNLYDESTGAQCSPIYIDVLPTTATAAASESSDGQITASVVSSAVTQISDGQIQATTSTAKVTSAGAVSQISDGQIQATTVKTTSAAVVTQISDGQIQATTGKTTSGAVVTQISDGQIQATTAKATSGAVVTQISDGQIQATTAKANGTTAAATITTSKLTSASGKVVSQISDGQIQASGVNGTVASATKTAAVYTGAAMPIAVRGELFGLAAGVLAMGLL